MKLSEIKENAGARKGRMRVGRGIGSGKGKTAGRGVKGQKSRTGVRLNTFEGGQNPIYRTFMKRGFSNIGRKKFFAEITLAQLQNAIESKKLDPKKEISTEVLLETGVVRRRKDGVKILRTGELKQAVTLKVAAATKGAIAAVEKAGGKVELIPEKDEAKEPAKDAKPDKRKAKRAAKPAKEKKPAKPAKGKKFERNKK